MKFFQKIWPFLFFTGIFLILFYKVFFFGQVFFEGDNFYLNIPAKYFLVTQLTHGQFPLWNPYLFLGIPYFADFNVGALALTNIFYFFFSAARGLTLITIFDFFGLAVGMYVFLRSFSLSKVSAVFGGIVMSLSGMPFILLSNMTFLQVIVYIPFLFLLAKNFIANKTCKWFLLLILVQFFQFISGHPQETYYTMLFISFYLFFFLDTAFWKKMVIIFLYILFPLLLSSVQLLPFLEYVRLANRPVGSVQYAGWGGQTLATAVTFLFPTFYGSHSNGTWWGTQQILVGFIGIPPLFFLFIGIFVAKMKRKWFFVCSLIASFLLSFGALTPVFYLFYYLIPGWQLFRAPSGILVFYTFFAAILASFGMEYVHAYAEKYKNFGKVVTVLFGVLSIFIISFYFYTNKLGFWQHIIFLLQQHFHKNIFAAILFYDSAKIQQMFQGILWNGIFVLFFCFCTGFILWGLVKKSYQIVFFLFLTTCGFLLVNQNVILTVNPSFYTANNNVPPLLNAVESGKYRIFSVPVDLHQERQHLPAVNFFLKQDSEDMTIYQYDNNIEQGLYQIAGYTSLVPASFARFIGAKNAASNVTNIDFSSVSQKQLNLSSVRFILSANPVTFYNFPLVYKRKNLYIYKNLKAFPRVYMLSNPYGNQITYLHINANKISFTVKSQKPDKIILTDWYYPGWIAKVNGKQVKISKYDNVFQEIPITKGMSSVTLEYDPLSFKLGMVISFLALGMWIFLFVAFRKKTV